MGIDLIAGMTILLTNFCSRAHASDLHLIFFSFLILYEFSCYNAIETFVKTEKSPKMTKIQTPKTPKNPQKWGPRERVIILTPIVPK